MCAATVQVCDKPLVIVVIVWVRSMPLTRFHAVGMPVLPFRSQRAIFAISLQMRLNEPKTPNVVFLSTMLRMLVNY